MFADGEDFVLEFLLMLMLMLMLMLVLMLMLMLNSLRNESSHVARVKTLFAHQVHNVSPNTPKIARVLCYVTDSYFVLFPCHVVSAMFLCYDVFVVLKFFPCCHVLDSLFAVMHLSS